MRVFTSRSSRIHCSQVCSEIILVVSTGHRFMQDNDPKHTPSTARTFFEYNGINWWRTPPESPDANPIENLWHELKVSIKL